MEMRDKRDRDICIIFWFSSVKHAILEVNFFCFNSRIITTSHIMFDFTKFYWGSRSGSKTRIETN